MEKKLNILSLDSLNSFIKMFDELSEQLSSQQTIEDLTNKAYDLVKANVSEYAPVHASNIFQEVSGNTGKVYTNDKVLIYNEYGTGIVGSQNPHPDLKGWTYMTNNNINYAVGWHYLNEETGEAGFTKGLPARKGFYNSREQMKAVAKDKLKIIIENSFKKY